jgi:hypothetical protein
MLKNCFSFILIVSTLYNKLYIYIHIYHSNTNVLIPWWVSVLVFNYNFITNQGIYMYYNYQHMCLYNSYTTYCKRLGSQSARYTLNNIESVLWWGWWWLRRVETCSLLIVFNICKNNIDDVLDENLRVFNSINCINSTSGCNHSNLYVIHHIADMLLQLHHFVCGPRVIIKVSDYLKHCCKNLTED